MVLYCIATGNQMAVGDEATTLLQHVRHGFVASITPFNTIHLSRGHEAFVLGNARACEATAASLEAPEWELHQELGHPRELTMSAM